MSGAIASAYGNRFGGQPNYTPTASLTTPTYDASGVTTEPTWIAKPSWVTATGTDLMAHNPLTGGSDAVENPSILISNDLGATWALPPGVPDPIQPAPSSGHYADVHLYADPNANRLIITWTAIANTTANLNGIWYSICTDPTLVTWSSPLRLIYVNGGGKLAATNTEQESKLVWDPNRNRCLLFTQDAATNVMRVRISETTDPVGSYALPVVCTLPFPDGSTMWHMDIIRETSGRFVMVMCDNHKIGGVFDRRGWIATSYDAITWKVAPRPFMLANTWATAGVYRPSMIKARSGSGYDVIVARHQTPDARLGLARNIPGTEIP